MLRNVLFHLAGVKAKSPYDPQWLDQQAADSLSIVPSKLKLAIVPETDHTLILRAVSLMPSGLERQLTDGELADLVAYVRGMKGPH